MAAPPLQLPWPTGGTHRINSGGYSYNCGGHTGSNQYAIDFEFLIGQGVGVVASGTVVEAVDNNESNGGRGNYLTVDHGSGYVSRYLHLRWKTQTQPTFAPRVVPGTKVRPGKLSDYSGNTGGVAAHLHFDLKLDGAAYMPEPMSGASGFGGFGLCTGSTSYSWVSRSPLGRDATNDGCSDVFARESVWPYVLRRYDGNCTGGPARQFSRDQFGTPPSSARLWAPPCSTRVPHHRRPARTSWRGK